MLVSHNDCDYFDILYMEDKVFSEVWRADRGQGWKGERVGAGKAVGAMAIASVSSTGAGPWHDGRNGEEGVESAIQERKAVGVATIRSGWEEEDSAKCQKPVRCVRYARPGSFLHTQ